MKPIHSNPLNFNLIEQEFSLFLGSITGVQSDLRGYHRVVEELLAEAEAKDADKALASVDHLEEPRRSEVLAWHIPYWWAQTFVPQFRASYTVWAISALELHLGWAYRLAGGFAQTSQTSTELPKSHIVASYKKFFNQLPDSEAPDEVAWSRLADLYTIRNALAHSGGYVTFLPEVKRRELKTVIRRFHGIVLSYNVALEIDEVFCEDVVDLICSLCSYLLAQVTRARDAFLLRNPGHKVLGMPPNHMLRLTRKQGRSGGPDRRGAKPRRPAGGKL
jgi:hypothetical protein